MRTSVFGAAIFAGEPFVENINATVQTLYRDAVAKFGASAVGSVPPLVGCCLDLSFLFVIAGRAASAGPGHDFW